MPRCPRLPLRPATPRSPPEARRCPPRPLRVRAELAAICLTWELAGYACNLSCVHCLPRPRAARPARADAPTSARAVIDELQRMKVFYVNIGGGEPTVRSDFGSSSTTRPATTSASKFSTNGVRITEEIAARRREERLRRHPDLAGRRDRRGQRRHPRSGFVRSRDARARAAVLRGHDPAQAVGRVHADEHPQLDEFKAIADRFELSSVPRACARPGAGPTSGTSCTRRQEAAAGSLPVAARARRGRAHRRARSSTSRRSVRGLPGLEPVRRRPCRLPHRPDRRRLRLPVRDPRGVPGRIDPRGRVPPACGAAPSCSPGCARRNPAARARAASSSTRARAGAWPPEVLHRASPSTAPARNACAASASTLLAEGDGSVARPKPSVDRSHRTSPPRPCAPRSLARCR